MKKILSILLALSIACGSVMLTACGDTEKEDDDDKSVSDKERDEDDEDKDKDEESSEDEDESSEDEDEDDGREYEEGSQDDNIESFSDFTVEIFGDTVSWPFKAEHFSDYFNFDGSETIDPDSVQDFTNEDETSHIVYCNPSSAEDTAIDDCYLTHVNTSEPLDVFEFTVNGVGVGSSVDDINDAFGTDFEAMNGDITIFDDEYFGNMLFFLVEDDTVEYFEIACDPDTFAYNDGEETIEDEDESSEDEDEGDTPTTEDGTYAGGDVVEFSGVSFTVPEGYTCEITDGYAVIASEDEYALESINIQSTSADNVATYSQETFDEMYKKIYSDSFTSGTYEVSTLDDADTIHYTASIAMEGISMELIQYCIFMDDASVIVTMGYVDDADAATMDAFVDSFEVL